MSFGFGVGDFLAAVELANKLRKDFSEAPKQYQAIAEEVKNVSIVLEDIDRDFSGYEISDTRRQDLSVIAASIVQVLKDATKILNKYSKLDSKSGQTSLKGQIVRTWERVSFDNKDVQALRLRLVSTLETLTTFVDGLDRKVLATISARQDLIRNREILDWLAPANYAAQHSSILNRRITGSGQWILKNSKYQQWLQGKGELLFLQGIPGTGKTFLSAIIIDSIQKSAGTALCYYYCDYNQHINEQLCNTLACFLRQLSSGALPSCVESMFEKHYEDGNRPSLQSIREALYSVVDGFKTVWIVVDALDEYVSQRLELVEELLNLNKAANVNILVTSRPLPDISKNFAHDAILEVRARDEDISSYITTNLRTLPNFVRRDPNLQEEIKDVVIETADGIFLLATLNLQSLRGKRSRGHLEKILNSLKKGTSGYQDAYAKTMERISSQDEDDLAIDTLTWVVHAARPLKVPELLHALGTEVGASKFDERLVPDIDDVLNACCGLIHIEHESEIVRLIHRTIVEYLRGEGAKWLKEGHAKLSDVCNTYLAFDDLNKQETLEQYPFYHYASLFWRYHVEYRDQPPNLQQFVTMQQRIDESSYNMPQKVFAEYLRHSQQWKGITGLHLAAISGVTELMPYFLEFYNVDDEDRFHRTPVSYAVEQGHHDVLRFLVKENARLDFVYESGESLLIYAIKGNLRKIVTILINNGSPQLEVSDKLGRTPLHFAALYRNVLAIHKLLDAGAGPNAMDCLGCTPLLYAVKLEYSEYTPDSRGSNKLAHDLRTKQGISSQDIEDCVDRMLQQNKILASDSESIIRELISRGSDLTLADNLGRTPIWYAHKQCSVALLELLSFYPVSSLDVAQPFDFGEGRLTSPSQEADNDRGAYDHHIVTAHIPLDIGFHIRSYKERSIFHTAVASNVVMNHKHVMLPWLVDGRALIHKTNQDGWASSHQAVLSYRLDAVEYLPKPQGVGSIIVPDNVRLSRKFNASFLGSLRALKILIRYQISQNSTVKSNPDIPQARSHVNIQVEYVGTDSQRHLEVFPMYKETSERRDWFHAADKHGQNALHISARNGNFDAIKYLLTNGLDCNVRDKYGRTALEYACRGKSTLAPVAEILGSGFVRDKAAEKNTWSPLHWTCRAGNFDRLLLLAQTGFTAHVVSVDEPKTEWTPLDVAIFYGNDNLVTADGHIRPNLPWEQLLDAGLVIRDELNNQIIPVLRNYSIKPEAERKRRVCLICYGSTKQIAYRCLTCRDGRNYCLFCKHDGYAAHPGHQWNMGDWMEAPSPSLV